MTTPVCTFGMVVDEPARRVASASLEGVPLALETKAIVADVMSDLHPPAGDAARLTVLTVLSDCDLAVREVDAAELLSLLAIFTA